MNSPARKNHILPAKLSTAFLQAIVLLLVGLAGAVIINTYRPDGLAWVGPGPSGSAAEEIGTISLDDAWAGYRNGSVRFIDAREPSEYLSAHLPGACNIPAGTAGKNLGRFMSRDFSGKDLVIYCSGPGCPLSNELADALAGHGIKNVKVLPDGWAGWYEAGFPIEGEK